MNTTINHTVSKERTWGQRQPQGENQLPLEERGGGRCCQPVRQLRSLWLKLTSHPRPCIKLQGKNQFHEGVL